VSLLGDAAALLRPDAQADRVVPPHRANPRG
jgi:hypothetical protein